MFRVYTKYNHFWRSSSFTYLLLLPLLRLWIVWLLVGGLFGRLELKSLPLFPRPGIAENKNTSGVKECFKVLLTHSISWISAPT